MPLEARPERARGSLPPGRVRTGPLERGALTAEPGDRLSVILLNRQRRRRVSPARLHRVLGGAAAARLDPKSALAANNVGFTHYRLGGNPQLLRPIRR